ncbi:MAG: DUF3857 domain-containing protein [Paludibacter sp.]|nr:DUF3857 domain-containing protein [Paludibacter sp.]
MSADISDAVFVNQQTDLVLKNNKLYISRSYELQINNRQGEEYAEINIPYSKMSKVSKIEATIKDKNGIIIKKLKTGDIKERSSLSDDSFYDDNFVKEFTLIHNVYPYTICYSYQLQEESFLFLDHWSPCLFKDVPTVNATLTLDVPIDYKFSYSAHLVDSMRVDTVETRKKYTWNSSYTHQFETEILAPDKHEFIPEVLIVPGIFKFEQEGSFSSWKTYGNWEFNLLAGLNDLPEAEKQHIHSLVEGIKDDIDKIKVLYHYLQDVTRYINISIETGGMKPYPASYVANNKYGDCKALTNYFKAVLSCVGIPSIYTNIHAGDRIKKIDQNFPSMQFNHVFLCVPLPKDTFWLDCTSDGPFNYLGTFTQNRIAFLIEKDNSHFIRTPGLSKEQVLDSRTIRVNSNVGNDLIANFHTISRGESFESLSGLTRSVSDSKKSQIIRKYLIESGFEMIDFNLIPAHRDSAFVTLDYSAKADKLFKKYGNELLIPLIPFSIPAIKAPKNRKYPIQLDYPIYKTDTIHYKMPDGYQLSSMPINQTLYSKYGKYDISFLKKDDNIHVIKSFVLNAGEYTLKEYADFYKFVKQVYDFENSSYIVTKKQD